jgi:predicted dehydrogenase
VWGRRFPWLAPIPHVKFQTPDSTPLPAGCPRMAPMKAALIGAGQIARQHLTCLQSVPGVDLVGVCDLSPAAAECAAERHGVHAWFTDRRVMLTSTKPDVVHITTPPASHFRLALEALEAGAHVIVEKPITGTLAELEELLQRGADAQRAVVEDYNYLFNAAPREIAARIQAGKFGAVVHVEVMIALNILGPGGFADPNAPHPILKMPGGAIADFLPHLASLAYLFVGPHRRVQTLWRKRRESLAPYDEFRGLIEAERGTATLTFTSSAQPDAFWLRVYGEQMQATANLFETRMTFNAVRSGPPPLMSLRNGLDEGLSIRRAARATLWRKFKGGPGTYEGLYELIERTYRALSEGTPLPVSRELVLDVNRLVDALKPEGSAA